ncbi:armadillo-like helical domain-containing protein [Tanacetum coccineum]
MAGRGRSKAMRGRVAVDSANHKTFVMCLQETCSDFYEKSELGLRHVNYIQAWNSFSHGADCMGAALVALGPETFLKFLPLNVEAHNRRMAFPILKQNIVGARWESRQNKQVIEGENEPATLQKLQLVILRSSAREILPTLSGIFIKSSKYDDGGSLQFFQETMEKLLKVTEEAGKVQNTKGSSSMEVDNSSSETSLSQTRLGKDLPLNSNPGIFRFVVCQADEAPNDDISETIFSASSGPMLCSIYRRKKDAVEGKRSSVPTLMT